MTLSLEFKNFICVHLSKLNLGAGLCAGPVLPAAEDPQHHPVTVLHPCHIQGGLLETKLSRKASIVYLDSVGSGSFYWIRICLKYVGFMEIINLFIRKNVFSAF